jgi:hypothetical protein
MEAEPRKAQYLEILNYTLEQNGLQTEDDPVKYSAAQEANKNMEREVKMVQTGATDMFLTIRDCHMTARLIMGDLGVGKAAGRREKISATSPTGENQKLLPTDADRENFATVGQKGAVKLLKYAFSSFGDVLTEGGYSESHAELIKRVRKIASKWNYTEAIAIYGDIQEDAVIGSLFNRTYSVNEHAKVAVGQALVQVNDENERLASVAGTLGKDLWNFHWAGVLMMDGDDYVTLQAVADQMASTLTVNWWFKMYGTGKQSFHSEEKKDTHVGTRPLTMGVLAE